jgi:two-component system, LuxR family, response regulator FixJ
MWFIGNWTVTHDRNRVSVTAVYIVDDDPEVRKMTSWLVQELGYRNHPFATADDFLDTMPHLKPGCMLIDLCMHGMSGIELIKATSARRASFPAVIMTGYADVDNVVAAMKAGAMDILQKPVTIERLEEVIGAALLRLEPPTPPKLEDGVPLLAEEHRLTERQTAVLRGLVAGRSNKETAAALKISTRTVEMHRAAVMAKLGVHSLPALLRMLVAATVRPQPLRSVSARAGSWHG